MTAKHTPGPRKVGNWTVAGVKVWAKPFVIVADCPALIHANGAGTVPDERVANARLIAAAPELLAALRDLADYAADRASERDERPGCLDAARAAIAAATGEGN